MRNQSCIHPTGIVGAVFMALLTLGEAVPLPSDRGIFQTTVFRGRELSYEVINGMAVHGGDIILGTAEEAAAASPRHATTVSRISMARLSAPDSVSAATGVESEFLWPGGVIPYVIDEDVTNTQEILRAIEEWNTKTVISLVERTTQEDYVRFKSAHGGCRAQQGRVGGEQLVLLHETCDWRIVVHEIGHAVGLWHEHQRQDRDRYLMVQDPYVNICINPFALVPDARVERPYQPVAKVRETTPDLRHKMTLWRWERNRLRDGSEGCGWRRRKCPGVRGILSMSD